MIYDVSPFTLLNPSTNQYETSIGIDGETICFMCDEKPEESRLRAVKAAMLMAIEEADKFEIIDCSFGGASGCNDYIMRNGDHFTCKPEQMKEAFENYRLSLI